MYCSATVLSMFVYLPLGFSPSVTSSCHLLFFLPKTCLESFWLFIIFISFSPSFVSVLSSGSFHFLVFSALFILLHASSPLLLSFLSSPGFLFSVLLPFSPPPLLISSPSSSFFWPCFLPSFPWVLSLSPPLLLTFNIFLPMSLDFFPFFSPYLTTFPCHISILLPSSHLISFPCPSPSPCRLFSSSFPLSFLLLLLFLISPLPSSLFSPLLSLSPPLLLIFWLFLIFP